MSSPPSAAGATKDSTRCGQAECIAARNELALLQRDLDEIERENEQLHDQLARKDADCSALALRLQQSERDAALAADEAQTRVAARDTELVALRATVQQLQKDVADARVKQPTATATANDVLETLRAENAALQATVSELRAAIARETAASAHANREISAIQSDSKTKRDELYHALKENELLRRERQERDDALEKVSQLALDYETALKVLHDQQRDYVEALDELRIDNTQQRTRVDQLEREKELVERQLIDMDEHETHVDVVVKDLTRKHEMDKAVLRAELDELKKQLKDTSKLQSVASDKPARSQRPTSGSVAATSATSSVLELEEMEKQLEMVHELRVQDQLTIEDKDREIQQLREDLEKLVEHLHETDAGAHELVQHAVDVETAKHKATVSENAALKRRLKEQSDLVEQLEMRQAQLENDLVDAQEWNAKYEANAGLEDVMKYQKKLRKELEKQQLANQKLRQELNDQRDATGKLHVAFERLKDESGKPQDFGYDDLAIEAHFKGELAVQHAVMQQMELQIHELENERVKLLQKLRQQARVVGGKLYEAHGLTVDQWTFVEDFIERMRLTPEVAKRLLMSGVDPVKAENTTKTTDKADAAEDLQRLQRENTRLREALEGMERQQVTRESVETSPQTTQKSTATKTQHVATSPLKTPRDREEPQKTTPAVAPQQDSISVAAETTPSRPTTTQSGANPTPEALAQAIAAALDARLAAFQQASAPVSSKSTTSVATQPSPSKTSSTTLDISTLAMATDEQFVQQIDFLKEFQVLLDDYIKLEAQNASLRDELTKQHDACQSLMDQQSVAYQHFFHLQDASTTEKHKLQYDLQQLKAQHQELALKCQRYEATLHTLQTVTRNEDSPESNMLRLRSEIVDLTRRVAQDEITTAKLKREHALLQEAHALCVRDAQLLEDEWLEMERVLKFRILYLESWKSGAENMLAKMDATLDKCALKSVADAHEKDLAALLAKYSVLTQEYVDVHAKYVAQLDMPGQISRLQHENAMLLMERGDTKATVAVDAATQARILALQEEIQRYVEQIRELEGKLARSVVAPPTLPSKTTDTSQREKDLEAANAVLIERIHELEQLYESLEREHRKSTEAAELAASQAKTLSVKITQEKAKLQDKNDQLKDLMSATEDHAIVAHLQQKLVQLTANYQQFVLKYDQAIDDKRQATLRHQHAELQLESQAKQIGDEREKMREKLLVLETAIAEFTSRDYMARNAKFEAFKKRLDALEVELRDEQTKRRALEKEIEDRQNDGSYVPSTAAHGAAAVEVTRLRTRVQTLETRERVLMGQLEALAKAGGGGRAAGDDGAVAKKSKEIAELQRVNNEVMRTVQSLQTRNQELLKLVNEAETSKRQVQKERDDMEMAYHEVHAQLQMRGGHGGDNQASERNPSSPLMRKKVGLYEKDHAEQQQAAQASIASLKQLLTEKNATIADYQNKLKAIRGEIAASKAQERLEASQLHKQLYDDNQKMIAQLKEATEKIYHLEKTGSDKKALHAAQERHEHALQEWKRVEVELETARSRIRELEMEVRVLSNERDIAEARAGEALEEIVVKHEALQRLEKEKAQCIDQLTTVKHEMTKREDKMQLLRTAIVKLKEEFLKAEDRHAVEIARATSAVAKSTKQGAASASERAEWKDEKERLEAQVEILQEKLRIEKKKVEDERTRADKALKAKSAKPGKHSGDRNGENGGSDALDDGGLKTEVERLKNALKEKVVSEARVVDELEKKIKVLQAQNLALRESVPVAAPAINPAAVGSPRHGDPKAPSRETWENEKRLQRRVDVLSLRLKEKQSALETSERETEAARQKLADTEQKLKDLQRVASSAREAIQGATPSGLGEISGISRMKDSELERQNKFLQETLILKRKEWEDAFQSQMETYEAQLQRLRRRLGGRSDDTGKNLTSLEREERAFIAAQDLQDELSSLTDEMREKDKRLMERDTRIMELELELESLRVEYQKLHRKSSSGTASAHPPTTNSGAGRRGGGETGRVATGSRIPLKSSAQERMELEEVIENMKKVIEKLRAENDKLKRQAVVSPDKINELKKKLRDTRDSQQQLLTEVEGLRHENAELKKEKLRLQQRVRVLSAAKSPGRGGVSDDEVERQRSLLKERERELSTLHSQLDELESRVNQKDAMIRELSTRIADDRGRGGDGDDVSLRHQLQALQQENADLKHELGAFDHEFFEEIEDLKFKYAEAVRDKQQLEQRLRGRGV